MKQTDPNEDRLAAMRLFVSLLERDRVAIVSFGNDSRIEVPLTSVAEQTQRDDLLGLISDRLNNDTIPKEQATDMLKGLTESYGLLAKSRQESSPHPSRQVIILLTDGAPCRLSGFFSSQDQQQYNQEMIEEVEAGNSARVNLFAFGFLDPNFKPNPQNPCENPDPGLLTELNQKGLQGLEADPQVLAPFLRTDSTDPEVEEVYLKGTDQIVDRYIAVWEALYGIDRSERDLSSGVPVIIPPGTRTVFAIVEFEPPARPTLKLVSGQGPEEFLSWEIGKYLVARKDNPATGWRVELANDASGEARLLFRLDYYLQMEAISSPLDTGSHPFAFEVERKPQYPDAPDRSEVLAPLLRLEVRRVDEDNRSKCELKEGQELIPLRDGNRFKRDVELSLRPGEPSAEFVVVAGTTGLEDCVRSNEFTVRSVPTPTPTATPVPPIAKEGGGGGLPWWVYVIIVLGLGSLGLFGWWLASRTLSQRPGLLEGTLSGRALPGGRVDLGELKKQRVTLGGVGSDIEVVGINGSAAKLFTERYGVADVTMLEPTGMYDVYVVPRDRLSQFDLVGLAGLPAVSGATDVGREALILLTEAADDSEIARIEWRASSSF